MQAEPRKRVVVRFRPVQPPQPGLGGVLVLVMRIRDMWRMPQEPAPGLLA